MNESRGGGDLILLIVRIIVILVATLFLRVMSFLELISRLRREVLLGMEGLSREGFRLIIQ